MLRRERNSIYMLWSYLFLGSFLLGILTMNLGSDMFLLEMVFSALHRSVD